MRSIRISFHRHLKQLGPLQTAIVITALATLPNLAAAQHRTLDLREQVEQAAIIVVGAVNSVQETGITEVEISGHRFRAKVFDAQVRTDRVLKGSKVLPQAVVRFILPISPAGSTGYGGITSPSYRILLLKPADDHFEFANPFSPSLPATPGAHASSPDNVLAAVVDELANAIDSAQTAEGVKLEVIYLLGSVAIPRATGILRQQLATSDAMIRASAAAALLQHSDMPALAAAQELLIDPPAKVPKYMLVNLSSAIGRYVKDERAIPSLRVLLGAADVLTRRAAAFALRNTGSELAIPALAIALGDTDSEVRYYAVIGLGEIANQPDWRPLMDDYALGEQKYLQYWRAWAAANGVQPK